jgi:manganese/iron transport system permease protein
MRPGRTHALLLALIAAAVIGSYQSVGTLLVFGLLVGPPATAALLARTVPMMMAISVVVSLLSVVIGLVLSYHLGTAGSATMALVPVVLFFLTLGLTRLLARRRRAAAANGMSNGVGAAEPTASVSGGPT